MLNENSQPTFAPERGLRQEDPLSSYMFIFCVQVFFPLNQKSIVSCSIHEINISMSAIVIFHLLVAEDNIVFNCVKAQEVECVRPKILGGEW